MKLYLLKIAILFTSLQSFAQHEMHSNHTMQNTSCDGDVWNYSLGMCTPLARGEHQIKSTLFHFNSFFVQNFQEGPRGKNNFSIPNMFMVDSGFSKGHHYLSVNVMATVERWTFPKSGYPELLQTGEKNEDDEPYIDAQHPHSSPIMGLTFNDTIFLGPEKNHIRLFFAPRGQSTDGPIAFMHRETGIINPDAPLGHHIGQDSGHITSTVLGASFRLNNTTLETSGYNGDEPEPGKVDLPIGNINSHSFRIIHELNEDFFMMASIAKVKDPESYDSNDSDVKKYSASFYNHFETGETTVNNSFIWGQTKLSDLNLTLNSFTEEFLISQNKNLWWGRIEHLQRTASELDIVSAASADPEWVSALTIGYTKKLTEGSFAEAAVGVSLTQIFLPESFKQAYGGNPISGRIFLQLSGMIVPGLSD